MQFTANQLTTNEIRSRLAAFAHQWQHASSEEADEKLFTAAFLACFGIGKHQYKREYAVPRADGSTGYMDGWYYKPLHEVMEIARWLDEERPQYSHRVIAKVEPFSIRPPVVFLADVMRASRKVGGAE